MDRHRRLTLTADPARGGYRLRARHRGRYYLAAIGLSLALWAAIFLAAFLLTVRPAQGQLAASQGFNPGASTQPVDFDEVKRCEGGTEPGSLCTVSGDCAGSGTCVTAWTQTSAVLLPSWCVTRNEQRTVGTSLVDAFSSTTEPACSVRVKNCGATTLYVGWSGVTTSNGVPVLPGEYGPPMYPPNRSGTAVKLIGDAGGGCAAVVTP